MSKVVNVTYSVALKCVAGDTHIRRETHDLFRIYDEVLFEAGLLPIHVQRDVLHRHRHAVEIFSIRIRAFIHENFGMAVAE